MLHHLLFVAFFRLLTALALLGDLWIVLPLALILVAWCVMSGERRGAASIALATVGTLAATALLKLVANMVGSPWKPHWEFVSNLFPSGHVAMSVVVYGALALCVGRASPRLGGPFAAAFVVMIGLLCAERVIFHIHPFLDVVGGLVLGCAGLVALTRLWPHGGLRRAALPFVAATAVLTLFLFYGKEVPSGAMIAHASASIYAAIDAFKGSPIGN